MLNVEILSTRTLGQYPLSIATSLAMESVTGIHPDLLWPTTPILDYDEYWFNLRTLYRNLLGAVDRQEAGRLLPEQIAEVLYTEWETIKEICQKFNRPLKTILYVSEYRDVGIKYGPYAQIHRDRTDLQVAETIRLEKTIAVFLKLVGDSYVKTFDCALIPTTRTNTLITTHIAYDLTHYKAFEELTLLETHTGAIKTRALWYTKFHDGKSLSMIPFGIEMLVVFGDSYTFKPLDIKLRRTLVELAKAEHWTQLTSHAKMKYGIDKLKDREQQQLLTQVLTLRT